MAIEGETWARDERAQGTSTARENPRERLILAPDETHVSMLYVISRLAILYLMVSFVLMTYIL